MFVNNIDPVLFKIGFFEIRYYGLVYLLGFLLVFYTLKKNKKELNLTDDNIYDLLLYLFFGVIFGARLFYFIFDEPFTLINEPLEFFKIWHGGMSFFGSLIGVLLSGFFYCKRKQIDFFKLGDYLVIPTTIALIFGRIANFINGEIVGTVTNLPWCVLFEGYSDCRHPYQIYASFSHFILLLILFRTRKIKTKNGVLLINFIIFYSVLRVITDFFRDEPKFFGLTIWQLFSIVFAIIGLIVYKRIKK